MESGSPSFYEISSLGVQNSQAGQSWAGWAVLGRLDQAFSLDLAALRQASLAENVGEKAPQSDQDVSMEGANRRG